MTTPEDLEQEADREKERSDSHLESEELLRRQAQEQEDAERKEAETHEE